MVKSELVDEIATRHPTWAFKDVVFAVNFILETMSETLIEGDRIEIRSFGSFKRTWLGKRRAHNPKTGERVVTTGKWRAWFKAAKGLRARVTDNRHLEIKEGSKKRYEEETV
jgi:integration host factor subunit beta